jgi:adenine deaminase
VNLPQRLSLSPERRRRLVAVARGAAEPDAVVRAGRMLDVYTGELREAEIGIAEGRVAWVGDVGARGLAPTLDLRDGVVVPGFIEPHCHPDILYSPATLAEALALRGTTTVCADTAFLSLLLDDDELLAVVRGMSGASVKFLWNLRGCLDGVLPVELERLSADRLRRLVAELPDVVATGEMTAWPEFLGGDERLTGLVDAAIARGLRIDGHAAGASARTLGPLAAAGITADHEAITPDELLARARLGYWLILRHSSLRPDAPALAEAITSGRLPTSRVMLTTDGLVATDLVDGHLDAVIREMLKAGVSPVDAVRMATLNPATYLGLDAHLGGIAPGRLADLVLVDSLTSFQPQLVLCEGTPMSPESVRVGFTDWSNLHAPPFQPADLDARQLIDVCRAGPAMRLEGVITRLAPASADLAADASYAALIGRDGTWVVGGVVHGLPVTALASTFSGSGDVVVLGRDPDAVLAAYREVLSLGGGIATHARSVPFAHLGSMYGGSVAELAAAMHEVNADLRYPAELPPVEYLLLFLTIAVLPDVRLTPVGAITIKARELLAAPTRLPGTATGKRNLS